jgi:beta-lactamase superfamily II metal-dependent hydrolase
VRWRCTKGRATIGGVIEFTRGVGVAAVIVSLGCNAAQLPPIDNGGVTPPPSGACGTGSWRPGRLEIHHIDIGQGDSTLIVSPTGRTLLVDVGEPRWDRDDGARVIGPYVRGVLGCERLDQVLITHFHVDHIGYPEKGGLWSLVNVQGFTVGRMFHRNTASYMGDTSGTAGRWRDYLAGAGRSLLHPEVVEEGTGQIDLGPGVSFRVVAVDGHGALKAGDFSSGEAPPNENDYSAAAVVRYGQLDYFIGGDLSGELVKTTFGYTYHDIEFKVARDLPDVDVYRAGHHGSEHSSSPTLLAQIDPEVSIISDGDGNSYGHPRQETVDRLLATSVVYLTERGDPRTNLGNARVAGHVVVRSEDGLRYEVNGDSYIASDPARVDQDGDGYFREADPDDGAAAVGPAPRGGCDPVYQSCLGS